MSDDKCECCGAKIEHYCDEDCKECDEELLPPNIREVKRQYEVDELNKRCEAAIEKYATTDNLRECIEDFRKTLQKNGKAIKNIKYDIFRYFVENLRENHKAFTESKNYELEVFKTHYDLCKEKKADPDHEREMADDIVFGRYKNKINFAALSINNKGLQTYGEICLHLKNNLVEQKATLLDENSQFFPDNYSQVKTHEDMVFVSEHRALWDSKEKLAVAKLAKNIRDRYLEKGEILNDKDFSDLLLCCSGKRTDNFIEIHIYGPFTMEEVKEVHGKHPENFYDNKDDQERDTRVLKDILKKYKIHWDTNTLCI